MYEYLYRVVTEERYGQRNPTVREIWAKNKAQITEEYERGLIIKAFERKKDENGKLIKRKVEDVD